MCALKSFIRSTARERIELPSSPFAAQSKHKVAAGLLLIVILSSTLLSSVVTSAAAVVPAHCTVAKSTATASVDPCTDLRDGQFVTVAWAGLPAAPGGTGVGTDQITYLQCKTDPQTKDDCLKYDPRLIPDSPANTEGTGQQLIPIKVNDLPTGFKCDSTNPCSIVVIPYSNADVKPSDPDRYLTRNFARRIVVPITFAPPEVCLSAEEGPGGSYDVAARRAVLKWLAAVCAPEFAIAPIATELTSFVGLESFAAQDELNQFDDLDFVITTVPPTAEERATLKEKKIDFAVVPVALSGLAIGFNINDENGPRILDLRITAEIFTKVLTNTISETEPALTSIQENPDVRYRGRLDSYKAAGFTASVRTLTSWINADPAAKTEWATKFANSTPFGGALPADAYPNVNGDDFLVSPEDKVPERMANRQKPSDISQFVDGALLGWMDSSLAGFYGLPMAKIPNRFPVPDSVPDPDPSPDFEFVAPTFTADGSLVKAVNASLAKETALAAQGDASAKDEFLDIDYAPTAQGAYPMPVVSYMVIRTDLAEKGEKGIKKSEDLKKFTDYILDGGQKALPSGYAPLPAPLVARGKAAAVFKKAPKPEPTPNPSATPRNGNGGANNNNTTAPPTTTTVAANTTNTEAPTTTVAPQQQASTTTTRPAAVTTTTVTRPPAAATQASGDEESGGEGEESAGEEGEESIGEEGEVPEEVVEEGGDFETFEDSSDLGSESDDPSSFSAVGPPIEEGGENLPTPNPVSFSEASLPEKVERIVGALESSSSRLLLPMLVLLAMSSLMFAYAGRVPVVLRGWNPSQQGDTIRRVRDVIDRRLIKEP